MRNPTAGSRMRRWRRLIRETGACLSGLEAENAVDVGDAGEEDLARIPAAVHPATRRKQDVAVGTDIAAGALIAAGGGAGDLQVAVDILDPVDLDRGPI